MKEIAKQLFIEILVNIALIVGIYFLWNWLFIGIFLAKKISIVESWGLRTLFQFLVYNYNPKAINKKDYET